MKKSNFYVFSFLSNFSYISSCASVTEMYFNCFIYSIQVNFWVFQRISARIGEMRSTSLGDCVNFGCSSAGCGHLCGHFPSLLDQEAQSNRLKLQIIINMEGKRSRNAFLSLFPNSHFLPTIHPPKPIRPVTSEQKFSTLLSARQPQNRSTRKAKATHNREELDKNDLFLLSQYYSPFSVFFLDYSHLELHRNCIMGH